MTDGLLSPLRQDGLLDSRWLAVARSRLQMLAGTEFLLFPGCLIGHCHLRKNSDAEAGSPPPPVPGNPMVMSFRRPIRPAAQAPTSGSSWPPTARVHVRTVIYSWPGSRLAVAEPAELPGLEPGRPGPELGRADEIECFEFASVVRSQPRVTFVECVASCTVSAS